MTPDDLGPLGEHLPAQLPGGFSLQEAWLYHTTMKNGAEYDMLRGSYALEDNLVPMPDGTMEAGEDLCVMVYDHRPQVERREIYTREALADYLAGQTEEGLRVTFSTGDVYVNSWCAPCGTAGGRTAVRRQFPVRVRPVSRRPLHHERSV